VFNRDTVANVLALIKDMIDIDEGSGMVEVKLPEENTFDHFVKLAEEHRRERQRRLDAGDETAELKFKKPTPVPPGKAPMLNAAKAGQGRVIAGQHPVFQVGKNLLLKPVVVSPVKATTAAVSHPAKASHIRPAAKAPLIRPVTTNIAKAPPGGPLKAGLIRPGSSPSAPGQGVKRPQLSAPKTAGVVQPATKVARTSFGGGAKW